MQNKKIITLGELMLRLSPPSVERFVQAESYCASFGGAEANVAVSLANFGLQAGFITKLPDHEIGQAAVNSLRRYGVDVSGIVRGGDRVGLYYCENGTSMRPSKVVYDRKGSSFAAANEGEFEFDELLKGADWFHFTGITPALSKQTEALTLKACKAAKRLGLTVSCDLNYRAKLWTKDEARKSLEAFMPYVDVCISNVPQIFDVFGIAGETPLEVAQKTVEKFAFSTLLMTERESYSASDNDWSAYLFDGKELLKSKKYQIRITDRVGGGDAFAAGYIYGALTYENGQKALEFATAAAALAHTIEGDYNLVSAAEVETLVGGDGTGRVQR